MEKLTACVFHISRSGNTNRLRSLKSLPTKSASVYSLQVHSLITHSLFTNPWLLLIQLFKDLTTVLTLYCVPEQFSRRNLLFAAGALAKSGF